MADRITDPNILAQLNGQSGKVTDPSVLAMLKENPIPEGDWGALKQRLDTKEQDVKNSGPYRPQDIKATRENEARRQGKMYGASQGKTDGGAGLFGGAALNQFLLGTPRFMEAATNPVLPTAQAHEFLKAADEGRAEINPGTTLAGNVAGILGQVAALPVTGGATLGARALQAGAQSGTLGLAESGINSRGDIEDIVKGGVSGAVLGAAGSAAVDKAIQGGRILFDPLRGLAKTGPADQQATARVMIASKKAGLNPVSAKNRMAELGSDGIVADVLGNYGSRLGRNAANYSPEAETMLANAARDRVAGQPDRMMAALHDAGSGVPIGTKVQGPLGRPSGFTADDMIEAVRSARAPATRDAYDAAKSAGYAENIAQPGWLQAPAIQQALRHAKDTTQNRIAAYGEHEGSQLALYDAAKKHLDKLAREGDPDAGALARKLRQWVDESVPEYAGARGLAQTTKKMEDAIETGFASSKPRLNGAELNDMAKNEFPGLSTQAYVTGKINEIANRPAGQNALDIMNATTARKLALKDALGPKAADVERQIAAERQFLKFKNDITGNSKTAQYLLDAGALGGGAGGGALMGFDPVQSGAIGALLAGGRRLGKSGLEALAKKNETAVAPEIADILLSQKIPNYVTRNGPAVTETMRRKMAEEILRGAGRAGALSLSQSRQSHQ